MNRPDSGDLIARALRDKLSAAEKNEWTRLLEEDPELRATFAEEQALEQALEALPDVPISSNFTALTVQAATRQERPRRGFWGMSLPFLHATFARAVALLVGICAVGIAVGVHYNNSERKDIADKVRSFTEVASVISSQKTRPEELFQNFEAIQRLPAGGEGDMDLELLVALQK
jgi:anti-sigma factor RsiW